MISTDCANSAAVVCDGMQKFRAIHCLFDARPLGHMPALPSLHRMHLAIFSAAS